MQRRDGHERGGGIGAAATHTGLRGDALHEREVRATRE